MWKAKWQRAVSRTLEQFVEGAGTCGGRSAAAGPRALENGPSGPRLRLWEKGARPGRPPLEVAEAGAGRKLRPPPRRGARASKTGKASQTGWSPCSLPLAFLCGALYWQRREASRQRTNEVCSPIFRKTAERRAVGLELPGDH